MSRRPFGFTYIEACVSIAIVSMAAAILFPNVVGESAIRNHRLFKRELMAFATKTRNRAVETRRTVSLSYNKEDQSLEILEEDQNSVSKPFPPLKFPEGIKTNQLFADKNESPSDGWRVPFFSDGHTTGGGIEFLDGNEVYSFIIDRFSNQSTVIPTKLPDLSQTSWPAGGVQKRAQ